MWYNNLLGAINQRDGSNVFKLRLTPKKYSEILAKKLRRSICVALRKLCVGKLLAKLTDGGGTLSTTPSIRQGVISMGRLDCLT